MKNKRKIKQLISVLLAILMTFSTMMPAMSAFALEPGQKNINFAEDYSVGINYRVKGKWYTANQKAHEGEYGQLALRWVKDGNGIHYDQPLYCIQVYAKANNPGTYEAEDIRTTDVWNLELSQFAKIAITRTILHGYPNYQGPNNAYPREAQIATQLLIWDFEIGSNQEYTQQRTGKTQGRADYDSSYVPQWLYDSGIANKDIIMQCYRDILDACNEHSTRPSFHLVNVELEGVGYENGKTIIDTNGVLNDFEVVNNESCPIKAEIRSNSELYVYIESIDGLTQADLRQTIVLRKKGAGDEGSIDTALALKSGNGQMLWYGYLFDPVFANVTVELTTGDLIVTKYTPECDYDEHQYAGISFEVYGPNGYVDTITTDEWGYAYLNNLPMGEYEVREITPNQFAPTQSQTVVIRPGQTTNVDFVNRLKKFNVTLTKTDSETGTPQGNGSLAGAVYGIYNNGVLVDTYTTDSEGKFTTNYYTCGDNWTIQEITPSEGYLLDTTVYHIGAEAGNFNIEYNPLTQGVTEQVVKGDILIVKHTDNGDTQIETPETGAEFEVYLKSAGSYENAKETERDLLVIDEDGFAQTKQMPYGVYTVHQTKGWEGRDLIDDFDVLIQENGKTYKYIINNANFESYIKIVKVDKETKKQIPYAGAGFQIYDPDGNLVSMSYTYPTPVTIDTFYTNDKGYLVTPEQLPYGKGYKLVEVQAPYGYVLDSTPIDFDITRTNSVFEDGLTLIKLTKENLAQKGYIEIAKTGEVFVGADNSNGNYIPKYETQNLANATYKIYAAEDIVTLDGTVRARKGDLVDTVTTNKNGIAKSTNLYLGKYIVKEIQAPNGYVLDTKEYIVELTYAGQGVEITSTSMTNNNERQKVSVSLNKVLEKDDLFNVGMNDEIKSVKFGLYANEDVYIGDKLVIPRDSLITSAFCDENGKITFDCDLPIGYHWFVREIETDSHYILSDTKYGFSTYYQGQDTQLIEIDVNDGFKIDNELKRGRIEIVKKDKDTNEPLAGVEFGLFDKDKNLIVKSTTNEDGICVFDNVPCGDYFYQELACEDKYVIDDTFYPITVTENEQSFSFDIFNRIKQGLLKIFKTDKDTNEALAGVEFTIYDENGEVYQTFVTDENGYFEIVLPYGTYTLVETKCRDGYMPNNEKYIVTIDEDGKVITLDIKNASIPPKAPDTGATSLAGASALLFGLYSFIRRFKKNK